MFKGIQLTLMIGPLQPVPVPKVILESLTSISITTGDGKGEEGNSTNGFQISFEIDSRSPLNTLFLLSGSVSNPIANSIMRVVILVTLNGQSTGILDGVITNHEIKPQGKGKGSLLTITGSDLSVLMDHQDLSGIPYPGTAIEGRVALILAKYAALGITPFVIPSFLMDMDLPTDFIPAQEGTDLAYIKRLAKRVGYVFYIEPSPIPGRSIAYWGPQIKVGVPQAALNVDMDIHTNVESLSFNFDSSKNKIPVYFYYEKSIPTILGIPILPVTPISPPLGLLPPIPTGIQPVSDELAKYSIPRGLMASMAKAADSLETVTGTGSLDVLQYGNILKARQLVGVRGAGLAYNGLYYVKSVTHNISKGSYKQNFTLSRNGLISTIPNVPV